MSGFNIAKPLLEKQVETNNHDPDYACNACGDTGLLELHGKLVPCFCEAGKFYREQENNDNSEN